MCHLCEEFQKTGSLSAANLALTTLALSLRARGMEHEDIKDIGRLADRLHSLGLDGHPAGSSNEHKHFYAILLSIASGRLTFAALSLLIEDDDLLMSTAREAKMLFERKSLEADRSHKHAWRV